MIHNPRVHGHPALFLAKMLVMLVIGLDTTTEATHRVKQFFNFVLEVRIDTKDAAAIARAALVGETPSDPVWVGEDYTALLVEIDYCWPEYHCPL